MYGNRFLHMGRTTGEYACEIVGARGKHTRSFSSEADWRVEVSPVQGFFACRYHIGEAALRLLSQRTTGLISFLRLPQLLKLCDKHGEYAAAWINEAAQYTPCPVCSNEGTV